MRGFFGSKTDVFDKFLLPDFEFQLEIRSAKIVILPRENAVFYKIDILALKWQPMKNIKKQENHHFEIKLFFHIDFSWILEPTWVGFGFQVEAQKRGFFGVFLQEASKRRPRGSKSVPRASQEPPTASQEGPKSAQERSKRAQGTPKVPPKGHFLRDFLVFQCFCVFLRVPAFFCVFLCFFGVFLQRTPVNFSTLSSKLNCISSLRSKPKEAKASKSQLEFKLKISSTLDRACFCQARSSVELIYT